MHRDGQQRFIGWWDEELVAFVLHPQGSRPFQKVPPACASAQDCLQLTVSTPQGKVLQATSCLCTAKYTHSKGIHWVVGVATLASKVWVRLCTQICFFTSLPLSQRFCNTVPWLQHGLFIVPIAPAGFSGCSRSLNSNCVVSKDVPFGECRLCLCFAHAEHFLHFCHL